MLTCTQGSWKCTSKSSIQLIVIIRLIVSQVWRRIACRVRPELPAEDGAREGGVPAVRAARRLVALASAQREHPARALQPLLVALPVRVPKR